MKSINSVSLLMITLYFLACSPQNPQPNPFLTTNRSSVLVGASGGKDSVLIQSNVAWMVTGIPAWVQANTSSGTGDKMLVMTMGNNNGTQALTADITISGTNVSPVTLKVTQSGSLPFLSADKTSFTLDPFGGKDSVTVTSNVDWTITIPASTTWITADKLSGTQGITKVYLTPTKNMDAQSRNATIVLGSPVTGVQAVNLNLSQANLGITNFVPVKGPANTVVTITGNFGTNPTVKLNNIACNVTSSNPTQIVFSTPQSGTTGKVSVTFDGNTFNSTTDFTVTNTWIKILDAGFSGLGGNIEDGVSFVANNKIYFGFGILTNGTNIVINTSGFRIYDPATNQWSQGPSQPAGMGGRTNAGCAIANNLVYIGLGRYFNFYTDYWSFDPAAGTWKQLTNYPSTVGVYPLSFENQNTLYAGVPKVDSTMRKLNPLANGGSGSWSNAPLRFPKLQSSLCFTIGNYTYITGGIDSTGNFPSYISTLKFDPVNNTVTRVADLPLFFGVTQTTAGAIVLNGKGYVYANGNLSNGDLFVYDPVGNTWTTLNSTLGPGASGDIRGRLATINSEIYAWDGNGKVYKYVPL